MELGRKPLASMEYCYAALNNQGALLAQFSEGLKMLEESGEYRRIYDKWLGVYKERPPSLWTALRYSATILIPLLLILLAAFLWSAALRRQVAARTRELRDSLDRFQYIFEAANVGKSLTQPTGEIHANQAFADMLGYTREELNAKTWREISPPEDVELTEEALAPLRAGSADSIRFEKRYLRKDGACVWADVSAKMRRDSRGNPLYYVTTIVDITDRKQAERQLRESEARFRSYVENAPYGVFIADRSGRYVEANPAASRITGYTRDELLAMSMADLLPPKSRQAGEAHSRRLLEQGYSTGELPYIHRNGETRYWRLSAVRLSDDRFLEFAEDVTQRKRAELEHQKLEAQLLQAQKMESIGRLAGGVAHDFNNILQAMQGYSEILLDTLPEGSEEREFTQEIARGVERAATLTRQLLAFARRQTIAPKVLDLNETLESMLKMLRRLIGEDISLAWMPESGLWPVKMDPGQIDQILVNLCVNARDAIAGVGKVSIETSNATLDEAYCGERPGFVPGEYVLLAVSDDGCGMDKDTCEKIFEPFFTTKGLHEGTGLGLATVYGIVKQNDGFINVYSEPGRGTTFKIYLPRHASEAKEGETNGKAPLPAGKGESVLFVEDDASILLLGRQMLDSLGYRVFAASSPAQALDIVRERQGAIDLLITDVVMPEMNGRELAERARAIHPAIKTLFMSGYTANAIAHRGVLDPGVHFIPKPFSKVEMAAKVREAIEAQ